ncbi:MAG: ATP-grasp domain-containing protein [Candidatus Omnitrophica bacterium]|nr:ATP-grasp domain-containing protein [Candidatus Omnitrophota bacterium]MDD5356154.1 ATP-grasp domain-containing protein [Candidatus Omnitrophota bacterium]
MPKTIGFTYDVAADSPTEGKPFSDVHAEFDSQSTIDFVKAAIETAGYKVILIGNLNNLLKMLPDLKVDIIFNLCEGLGSRNREAQVPVILETFGIPYVGSDGLTMSLTLDKIMAKKIFASEKIPTPRYIGIDSLDDLINLDHMNFPMIVKLRHEGTSKGLSKKSVVYNHKELENQAKNLFSIYGTQPLLIEELIAGMEFTVPLIGNDPVEALPSVQVAIKNNVDLKDTIYTFDLVYDPGVEYICPSRIDKELEDKLRDLAVRTYKAVDCRDFGRVDFRVDHNNNPYVLEINPLPSLSPEDAFNLSPQAAGYDYNKAISKIIDAAFKRYGIN